MPDGALVVDAMRHHARHDVHADVRGWRLVPEQALDRLRPRSGAAAEPA